jgi:hypothetical protein
MSTRSYIVDLLEPLQAAEAFEEHQKTGCLVLLTPDELTSGTRVRMRFFLPEGHGTTLSLKVVERRGQGCYAVKLPKNDDAQWLLERLKEHLDRVGRVRHKGERPAGAELTETTGDVGADNLKKGRPAAAQAPRPEPPKPRPEPPKPRPEPPKPRPEPPKPRPEPQAPRPEPPKPRPEPPKPRPEPQAPKPEPPKPRPEPQAPKPEPPKPRPEPPKPRPEPAPKVEPLVQAAGAQALVAAAMEKAKARAEQQRGSDANVTQPLFLGEKPEPLDLAAAVAATTRGRSAQDPDVLEKAEALAPSQQELVLNLSKLEALARKSEEMLRPAGVTMEVRPQGAGPAFSEATGEKTIDVREAGPVPVNATAPPAPGAASSASEQVRKLPAAKKKKLAISGDLEQRRALVRDPDASIHLWVLKNPALTEEEAAECAALPGLAPEALTFLLQNRKWATSAKVAFQLACNPNTPSVSLGNILAVLPSALLSQLAESGTVGAGVVAAARHVLVERTGR